MNLNTFLDMLFGQYLSISEATFNLKCMELNKNPESVKEYLIQNGYIRVIANNHLEFIKYE